MDWLVGLFGWLAGLVGWLVLVGWSVAWFGWLFGWLVWLVGFCLSCMLRLRCTGSFFPSVAGDLRRYSAA